jgi:glycolate oxidase FAD binding subunit
LHVRLGVLPARLDTLLTLLTRTPAVGQPQVAWVADAVYGQIWAHAPLPLTLAEAEVHTIQDWLHALRLQAQAHQGYVMVESAPATLHAQLDVWGPSPGAPLLSLYKQHFDPHGVLNPGRYVAGL